MAWTAPMTATSGSAFSAADFNTHIRDNFNETMPALATNNDNAAWFVSDGANSLAKRNIRTAEINFPSESTTSTSYTDLDTTGPSVTLETSDRALVMINCRIEKNTNSSSGAASFEVSGASSLSALDAYATQMDGIDASNGIRKGRAYLLQTLTPGTNTFTMKYKVGSSTGTFNQRRIVVWGF